MKNKDTLSPAEKAALRAHFATAGDDVVFTAKEAAAIIHRGYEWLSRYRELGPSYMRYPTGCVMYRAGAIKEWLRSMERDTNAA